METKFKIQDEPAQKQLDILLDYYDIDLDDESEKMREAVKSSISKVKKCIMRGFVEITEGKSGPIINHKMQNSEGDQTVTYATMTGNNKLEMDKKEIKESYGRNYALMASLAGMAPDTIRKFKGIDLSIVESLGVIFLLA